MCSVNIIFELKKLFTFLLKLKFIHFIAGCFLFLTTISYVVADVSHLAGGNVSPGFKHSSGGDIPVVDDLSTRYVES